MFYEKVPVMINVGFSTVEIFKRYGIPPGRFKNIIDLRHNAEAKKKLEQIAKIMKLPVDISTPLTYEDPLEKKKIEVDFLTIPIDNKINRSDVKLAVNTEKGLAPLPTGQKSGDCTHGVSVLFEGTGIHCEGIRWIQTVTKINNPDLSAPRDFIDVGSDNAPWLEDKDKDTNKIKFTDTPCGPEPKAKGDGVRFKAVLSLVVWTFQRVTLIDAYTYGFVINPGKTIKAIDWNPYVRKSTSDEISNHIKTLEIGVNQYRMLVGGKSKFMFFKPPNGGSVNEKPFRIP